jgi:hypothetical protein
MTEPATEAGKRLLRSQSEGMATGYPLSPTPGAILAIEAEAREQATTEAELDDVTAARAVTEAILASRTATTEAEALAAYDENAAALLDALPSFLDDVRAFMDSPEPKRSPGVMAERRRRLTVSLVWMGQRAAALAAIVDASRRANERLDAARGPRP